MKKYFSHTDLNNDLESYFNDKSLSSNILVRDNSFNEYTLGNQNTTIEDKTSTSIIDKPKINISAIKRTNLEDSKEEDLMLLSNINNIPHKVIPLILKESKGNKRK